MLPYEKFKKTANGKKLIEKYMLDTEEDYKQWVEETQELWRCGTEMACDVALMEGMTIDEIEDIIL